jgi:nitrous oxidase accessory protein
MGAVHRLGIIIAAAALCPSLLLIGEAQAEVPLQRRIEETPPGGLLELAPGRYAGPIRVDSPIVIDGGGEATIDGGGTGSVIALHTDGATLRGLHITNSGENHDGIDAGIQLRGDHNVIEDNVIDDCLFGIDLAQSDENVLRGNRIGSQQVDMGVRGDGIRLWYSRGNQIVGNRIRDVRDVVVWYSDGNLIARNVVSGGRYALHFMYAKHNRVEENYYDRNMVGVFLMYSDGVELRGNFISYAVGATGMGIGFKESSNVLVEGNVIVRSAKGIYLDISPYEPDSTNRFIGNHIAFNSVGVVFHSDWQGNVFEGNDFEGNFNQVTVRGGGGAARHVWRGNRWDDYRGFDRNGDGAGDRPYELFSYADRFWVDRPHAAFFRGSPLFEAIDFLDRLAPFTSPTLLVRDESPRFEVDVPHVPPGSIAQ